MHPETYPRLVGDIGGTNARFAWLAEPNVPLSALASYPCADFESLHDAIQRYLADHAFGAPRWCAIGIANPVVGDRVQMTNHHWSFAISELRQSLGLDRLMVINDFTALAWSLPALDSAEVRQVGGGAPVPGAAIGLLGPGTGLGVSGLVAGQRELTPLNGEGGHVTLAPTDAREQAVVAWLTQRYGHASAERALSGPGLVNLYQAACTLESVAAQNLSAADVTSRALAGHDAACVAALDLFCSFLGNVAGNLALTLGARGGIYIGGGIVPKLGSRFDRSCFRQRFEQKGRFQAYLAEIPVYVVCAKTPALLGAARALEQLPPA